MKTLAPPVGVEPTLKESNSLVLPLHQSGVFSPQLNTQTRKTVFRILSKGFRNFQRPFLFHSPPLFPLPLSNAWVILYTLLVRWAAVFPLPPPEGGGVWEGCPCTHPARSRRGDISPQPSPAPLIGIVWSCPSQAYTRKQKRGRITSRYHSGHIIP